MELCKSKAHEFDKCKQSKRILCVWFYLKCNLMMIQFISMRQMVKWLFKVVVQSTQIQIEIDFFYLLKCIDNWRSDEQIANWPTKSSNLMVEILQSSAEVCDIADSQMEISGVFSRKLWLNKFWW